MSRGGVKMKIFKLQEDPSYRFYNLDTYNVQKYLSSYPYLQDNKNYAICPYCGNPVAILYVANKEHTDASIYARHVTNDVAGFPRINKQKLDHCLLSYNLVPFVPAASPIEAISLKSVNISNLRKAFNSVTGISFSNYTTGEVLKNHHNALSYRNVDSYNFYFSLLVDAKRFNLVNRYIWSNQIKKAITTKSRYFKLIGDKVVPKQKGIGDLRLEIKEYDFKDGYLPSITFEIYEQINETSSSPLISFKRYCFMYDGLVGEPTSTNEYF